MPRIRGLKPDFFKDEDLATLPFEARLLFAGMWCYADKEGRLEDRPKYLKAEIFPYDKVDVEKLLDLLATPNLPDRKEKVFIRRYTVNGRQYIDIPEFLKHQNPHHTEKDSVLPEYNGSLTVNERLIKSVRGDRCEQYLYTVSNKGCKNRYGYNDEFLAFWKAYPNKKEKPEAFKIWNKLNGSRPPLEKIIEAINKQIEWRKNAKEGEFRPEWKHPSTWLNKGCWDDEVGITEKKESSW
jgi:hypothetical protein